jgi:HEAT repeat protein
MAEPLSEVITSESERNQRRAYMDALAALGTSALPVAREMMSDSRWYVVRNAIAILRDAAGEAAMEHFVAGLAHDTPKVRREAIMALGQIGGENAGVLVPSKLSDTDPDVRKAAAMATGQLRVVRAVKPLLERLEEEPAEEVQVEILLALGRIGDPGAVTAIEKRAEPGFFQRVPTEVRIAAYRALWWIGTPRARKLVRDAEKDKSAEVRDAVARIIAMRPQAS